MMLLLVTDDLPNDCGRRGISGGECGELVLEMVQYDALDGFSG